MRVERGSRGAVAAAHPAAVAAGCALLAEGGNAVDAAIAAQAALGVVIPQSCGIGGDALFLVSRRDGTRDAINGTGVWPRAAVAHADTGGPSVSVPGAVEGWATLATAHGRLGLAAALAPAIRLAREGHPMPRSTAEAVDEQRERLVAGGAGAWPRLAARAGDVIRDEPLAEVLAAIAERGSAAFYEGPIARAIAEAVVRTGGAMTESDLAARDVERRAPLATAWNGGELLVQPPMSQAVLLAMAARWFEEAGVPDDRSLRDHLAVEAIGDAFRHRDRAGEGEALLALALQVDRERATPRSGPRSYNHTAGVATADAEGTVVSSLVTVFDDFGSAVLVEEGGFVLTNRAAGFTAGPNAPRAGARPVHTLSPALVVDRRGHRAAIATPGADGQVQTLLQVLLNLRAEDPIDVAEARPRWRLQDGALMIEEDHPSLDALRGRGHAVSPVAAHDALFGSVVAAGVDGEGPWAAGDVRREVTARGA